tara:strand:- start:60 stop:755 length:696 start_codon:yes stop_codon:yes gene_type:complete
MEYTKSQLDQIIQEEVNQAIEEGWLDRAKMRWHAAGKFADEVGPGQLARDVGKRIKGTAKYAATGEADPHKFAGADVYHDAKTRKGISLYRKKILDFADELENDIKLTGVDPKVFGALPETLKKLAVNFDKTLGASDKELRQSKRAGMKQMAKYDVKRQSEREAEKRAQMSPEEKKLARKRERATGAADLEASRTDRSARIEKIAARKLRKGQSEEEVNKWKEEQMAKFST